MPKKMYYNIDVSSLDACTSFWLKVKFEMLKWRCGVGVFFFNGQSSVAPTSGDQSD